MGAVATTSPARIVYATQAEQTRLSIYTNRLDPDERVPGGESFRPGSEPSPRERAAMIARLHYLDQMLEPTPHENVEVIRMMRVYFRTFRESEEEAEAQAGLWFYPLAHLPEWAVSAAMDQFVPGRAPGKWDRQRGPTAAEFVPVAQECMREVLAEAKKLTRIVNARIEERRAPTQADMEEVQRQVAALKAEIAEAALL
jgi:hypothetical protein